MRAKVASLACTCFFGFMPALAGQVADGVYTGVTTQARAATVTVTGGQITRYSLGFTALCGGSGTTTVDVSCPITGSSFTCGSAICNGVSVVSSISGSFEGPHVVGLATLVGPCCSPALTSMPWIASSDALLFADGFETASHGVWSASAGVGPFLQLFVRNRYWKNDGSDRLQVQVDGTPLFTLREAVPGWQSAYRPVTLDLAAFAGGTHTLGLVGESATDGVSVYFFVDDVALACAGSAVNALADPGFEAGTPNPSWVESSTHYGTPLCDAALCGFSGSARSGSWWAFFGRGGNLLENASLTQSVSVPTCP